MKSRSGVIFPLSLHDALPIFRHSGRPVVDDERRSARRGEVLHHRQAGMRAREDRKSTRLNSSHTVISYAVFCLKKKNNKSHSLPACLDSTIGSAGLARSLSSY